MPRRKQVVGSAVDQEIKRRESAMRRLQKEIENENSLHNRKLGVLSSKLDRARMILNALKKSIE